MGKKDPSKDKPKPPNREQIMADLASATEQDIVFTQHYDIDITDTHNAKEESASHAQTSHGSKSRPDESSKTQDKINETYEQMSRLIQLHNELIKEPKCLNEKYDHLEKLGQDVSYSIEELKSAAESVMIKAKK